MNYVSGILDGKDKLRIFLCLTISALVVRLVAFAVSVDDPGDGPLRAIMAYNWSKSPYISTYGTWPPGFLYLTGVFSFIVDNPLFSIRILNLIIGTLTVPLFYILVSRVYNHTAALLSASILIFLPMHVGLSVGSLTELSFSSEIIAGMTLLIIALETNKNQLAYLSLSLLCICLAEATRYEAWVLMPCFPIYYFWRTKKVSTSILLIAILLIFPVFWLLGNFFYYGNALIGFSEANRGIEEGGLQSVSWISAVGIIGWKSVIHLGWIILAAVIWGLVLRLVKVFKSGMNTEEALYLSITCLFWGVMLKFTVNRGITLWDRYLLLGFIMVLPFAAFPVLRYLNNVKKWLGLIILTAIVSLGVSRFIYKPAFYVTQKQPTEFKEVAVWLKESSYRNDSILLTPMALRSTYVPLYFPEIGPRHLTASFWVRDSELLDFLKKQKPSILITRDGDEKYKSHLEGLLGKKFSDEQLVHRKGTIKVYKL